MSTVFRCAHCLVSCFVYSAGPLIFVFFLYCVVVYSCDLMNSLLVQFYTLCPNKSDHIADILITYSSLYRIKHNSMNTYLHVLRTITQSFWKIRLSITQKSNCKQNYVKVLVRLYDYSIATCSQSPFMNQSFFLMVDVMDLATTHSLLQNAQIV